jgi:protein O-GlcNAc transferase
LKFQFEAHGKGIEMYLHDKVDTISTDIISNKTFFEHKVLTYIAQKYPINGTILDIGANIGNHSLFFATFLRFEHIVAFEPNKDNYELLCKNLSAELETIRCRAFNYAVGEKDQRVGLKSLNDRNQGMWQVDLETNDKSVEMVKLDTFAYDDVTLIKIDVEGWELAVLHGAIHTIRKCKPVIFVEAVDIGSFQRILTFLGYLGYTCVACPDDTHHTFEFVHVGRV